LYAGADAAAVLVPFLAEGLVRDERCIWLADSMDAAAARVRAALAERVPDIDERLRRGDLTIVERSAPPPPVDETAHPVLRWLDAGGDERGCRIAYTAPGATPEQWDRAARAAERALAASSARAVALCGYPADGCTGADVLALLSTGGRVSAVACGGAVAPVGGGSGGALRMPSFLRLLGHDLRNPINVMSLAADALLARSNVDPAVARAAARVRRNATKMNAILTTAVDFAGAQTPRGLYIEPAPMRLSSACHRAAEAIGTIQPSWRLTVRVVDEQRGRWDRSRVEQAVANMILGIAELGESVEITCRGDGPDQLVEVRIPGGTDDGRIAHIFEPMASFEDRHASLEVRLGPGLARAIARAHGGDVVATADELGVALTLRLPIDASAVS
jgi:hypothetical protein